MANFEKAFKKVISVEGGYVNDPSDRGGETKYGISKRSYPDVDIKHLTLGAAMAIYKQDYWDRMKLDRITSQPVAEEAFDTAVNCGTLTAGKILQKALNFIHPNSKLVVDGLIGPRSIFACNDCWHTTALLKCMNGMQFMHYYKIVKNKPSQLRFFRGWLKRV